MEVEFTRRSPTLTAISYWEDAHANHSPLFHAYRTDERKKSWVCVVDIRQEITIVVIHNINDVLLKVSWSGAHFNLRPKGPVWDRSSSRWLRCALGGTKKMQVPSLKILKPRLHWNPERPINKCYPIYQCRRGWGKDTPRCGTFSRRSVFTACAAHALASPHWSRSDQ